jgi:hypothetical protein
MKFERTEIPFPVGNIGEILVNKFINVDLSERHVILWKFKIIQINSDLLDEKEKNYLEYVQYTDQASEQTLAVEKALCKTVGVPLNDCLIDEVLVGFIYAFEMLRQRHEPFHLAIVFRFDFLEWWSKLKFLS